MSSFLIEMCVPDELTWRKCEGQKHCVEKPPLGSKKLGLGLYCDGVYFDFEECYLAQFFIQSFLNKTAVIERVKSSCVLLKLL